MEFITISNFPKDKIYVLLNDNYRKFLINKSMKKLNCKNLFELSLHINKISNSKFNGGDFKYWIEGKRLDNRTGKVHLKFMPLWLVLKLVKLSNENIRDLDGNVLSYRSGGSGLIVDKPKLPIEVTPELDSIVTHIFGDGAAGDFTPSYTQKNKDSFDNFIKKLENCFGYFEKSIYFTQGKHQIKFPKAISDILSEYYSINSYKSHESRIPNIILDRKDSNFKLACIISFIVDEGYVRDLIVLYSVNKILLLGIRTLVLDCGYSCSEISFNKKANSYLFALSNKDVKKFYKDVTNLSEKFSTCNLSFKQDDVDFIVKRREIKNPKDSNNTDKMILDTLKDRKLTVRQISKQINYAYCTILHHIEKLYDKRIVKKEKQSNGTYLWELESKNF